MTIWMENETAMQQGINYEKIAQEVVEASLEYVGCPYECELNILLTDNTGIQETNQRMRGMDAPTDVLSFPAISFEKAGDFSVVEESAAEYFNADTGELLLGDILISLEKAEEQAGLYGHSLQREFAFLIAHSMLHLSGYDHMEEEERIRMEQMQEEILKGIGYTRETLSDDTEKNR